MNYLIGSIYNQWSVCCFFSCRWHGLWPW